MNYSFIAKVVGFLLIIEAGLMTLPLLIALFYGGSDRLAFFISMLIIAGVGFLLSRVKTSRKNIRIKDALAIVTLGWFLSSCLGALPFVISGSIPSYVDAFFETVSGLQPPVQQ